MTKHTEPFLGWPGWRHGWFAVFLLTIGVVWFVLVYGGADWITAHRTARVRIHLASELNLPFVPEMVVVYMSLYFLFAAAPFVLRERSELTRLSVALNSVVLIAGVCFLLIPAELAFPPATELGAFPGLFRFADRLNLTYNLFPSLHVALAVVCAAALATRAPAWGKIALGGWALVIALSTILTRQHHLADVAGGILLGLAGFRWIFLRPAEVAA